jgi:hypothetical protein
MRHLILCVGLSFLMAGLVHAQVPGRYTMSPNTPFAVGLAATLIPAVTGIALMAAGSFDFDNSSVEVGFLLGAGGLLLGPAIGDWTGGLVGRGFAGFGLRTLSLFGGLAASFAICPWDCGGNSPEASTAGKVAIAGLGLATGLAIWDLATVRGAVRRNRAHRVTVMPTYIPSARAPGLAVRVMF